MKQTQYIFWKMRSSFRGSVTASAALAVPFFLFATLALLYIFEIYALQSSLYFSMMQVAKSVAAEYSNDNLTSSFLIKGRLVEQYGEERLNASIVAGGARGMEVELYLQPDQIANTIF